MGRSLIRMPYADEGMVTMSRIVLAKVIRCSQILLVGAFLAVAMGRPADGQEDTFDLGADFFGETTEEPAAPDGSTSDADATAPGAEGTAPAESDQELAARKAFQEARQLMEQEKWGAAAEKLQEVLGRSQDPGLGAAALFERAKCFKELKDPDRAVQSYLQAAAALYGGRVVDEELGIEIEPYQILLETAKVLIDDGRLPDALEYLGQAIDMKPTNPELYFNRGKALTLQGAGLPDRDQLDALESAVESFDRAIELDENYAEALYERGRAKSNLAYVMFPHGEWEEALEDLEKAQELDPENLEYLVEKGIAYLKRARQVANRDSDKTEQVVSDHRMAIAAFDRFIENHPDRPGRVDSGLADAGIVGETKKKEEDEDAAKLEEIYLTRADAKTTLARYVPGEQRAPLYREAIEDCDAALQVEPELPLAYYDRGVAWRLLGNFDQAFDDFTKAIKMASGFFSAYLRRGIVSFHRGDYELALGDFEKAMLDRPDGRAKFWSGAAHAQLGDFAMAAEEYSEALRQNPEYTLAYNNRGLAYLHMQLYERALDDFNELIRRDRTNAEAYRRRGYAYRGLNRLAEAERSFQRARELEQYEAVSAAQ